MSIQTSHPAEWIIEPETAANRQYLPLSSYYTQPVPVKNLRTREPRGTIPATNDDDEDDEVKRNHPWYFHDTVKADKHIFADLDVPHHIRRNLDRLANIRTLRILDMEYMWYIASLSDEGLTGYAQAFHRVMPNVVKVELSRGVVRGLYRVDSGGCSVSWSYEKVLEKVLEQMAEGCEVEVVATKADLEDPIDTHVWAYDVIKKVRDAIGRGTSHS